MRYSYVYLIAYTARKGTYGRIICPLDRKIKNVKDIKQIEKYIEKTYNLESVAIMSYQLICKERVEDEN